MLVHSLIINKFSSFMGKERRDVNITSFSDAIYKILKTGATQAISISGMETCRILI